MKKKLQQIRNQKLTLCCIAIVCMILLITAACLIVSQSQRTTAAGIHSYADIVVENYGTITVALDSDDAPKTVENFVSLAQSGFYDGLTFHRIIDGFMIQGGDPNGDGTGGAQQTVEGEFSANGVSNTLSHVRGVISMARSSDYNSASSQFFIVQTDSTYLDGSYAAFGYVIDGMEIVDALCADANPIDSNGTISANEQPRIASITIRSDEAAG
jgi:peptidyl-prolyl cis-trans isomerase B (cyclophilin B)